MSRIGKKPISIPEGIDIKISGDNLKGSKVEVKNSKGVFTDEKLLRKLLEAGK